MYFPCAFDLTVYCLQTLAYWIRLAGKRAAERDLLAINNHVRSFLLTHAGRPVSSSVDSTSSSSQALFEPEDMELEVHVRGDGANVSSS